MNSLAVFLWRRGALPEAESLLKEALEINRTALGDENPEVSSNLANLSLVLLDQGRSQEAETYRRQSEGDQVYEALGDAEKAAEYRERRG